MVVDDPDEAMRLSRQDRGVVLILPEDAPALAEDGAGRLAVFVGSPSDPSDRSLAAAMSVELFGS
jgi:hypothetical protein